MGDYWIYRENEQFLIFDAGAVAADHLPAHGHADLLTIEASVACQRLFVDTGTCCYEPGAMRNYCRSTAAHNTLQVDQAEQCDTWSSFRMGYRGHPASFCTGQQGGIVWAQASHDAYRRHGVPCVTRWIAAVTGQGPWICIDVADSRGTHQLSERLHLHPDVAAEFISCRLVRLCCAGRVLWLSLLGEPSGASLKQAWYCPRFGEPERNTVVEWSVTAKGQAAMGWALWFSASPGTARLARWNRKIQVEWAAAHGDSQHFVLSDFGHGDIAR